MNTNKAKRLRLRWKPTVFILSESLQIKHQAFTVSRDDFELAKHKMQDWGVRIHTTPAVDRPSGSGFYLFDSEGNLLQLYAAPK